jgi:hypothetical protein
MYSGDINTKTMVLLVVVEWAFSVVICILVFKISETQSIADTGFQ